MYDIDPPSPVLRLSDYRKDDRRIPFAVMLFPVPKCGTLAPPSFPAQLDRYVAAKADRWAKLHEADKASGSDATIFRACGAVERVKALRIADGDLAYALDSAL